MTKVLAKNDMTPSYMGPKFGVRVARSDSGDVIRDNSGNVMYSPEVAGRMTYCGGVYTYGHAFERAAHIASR